MKQELEYLALIVQDYISKQDRSVQIALAEKAQRCVDIISYAGERLAKFDEQVTDSIKSGNPDKSE